MKKRKGLIILNLILILSLLSGCFTFGSNEIAQPSDADVNEQIEQISEVNNSIKSVKSSESFLNSDLDSQTEMVLNEVREQIKQGKIKTDSVVCDKKKHVISYKYSNGVLGCDIVGGFDEEMDDICLSPKKINYDEVYSYEGSGRKADAVILNAMTDRDEVRTKCKELASEWRDYGISTKIDDTVTLDDLISLKGYEFVYFKMHGFLYDYNLPGKEKIPCLYLEEEMNSKNYKKHCVDIEEHESVGVFSDGHYFFTADFMPSHYKEGALSGSIFFLGSCQLLGAEGQTCENWTEAFNKMSVSAFVGFYNSNFTSYNLDLVNTFVDNLVAGKTVKESFEASVNEFGSNDAEWYIKKYGRSIDRKNPGRPVLKGQEDAVLKWENTAEETTSKTTSKNKKAETFNSFLSKGYNSADEYKKGLPVFYSVGGNNKKNSKSGQIWKDYIIADLDNDGEKELLLRLSFYTGDVSNEGGDMFYYYEIKNGAVVLSGYSYIALGYKYEDGMTLFYNNGVVYDERGNSLNFYIFDNALRRKHGLNEGEYLSYDYESDKSTGEITRVNKRVCSTYDIRETKTISQPQYIKESDELIAAKYLNVSINPATSAGIKKSK